MLSVQRYQPFQMHNQPSTSRRHQQPHIVERGRSRDVSQAALARRKSEERRRRAVAVFAGCHTLYTPRATSPPVRSEKANTKQRAPLIHNTPTTFEKSQPVASSSSCQLPSPQPLSPPPAPTYQPMLNADDSDCASASTAEASNSRHESYCVTSEPYPVPVYTASSLFDEGEESPDSEHSMSLQDEMQQAYAACQTSCLPSPSTADICRCPSMRRARVLYLKTQGIDVTSDDDPRIDQVRDEDFVFPGGELVLDEESLAALNEERMRREKEAEKNKWRVRGHTWEVEAERAREAKALSQRAKEEAKTASPTPQRLEFKAKRGRALHANPAGHIRQCAETPQPVSSSSRIELDSSFRPSRQPVPTGTTPCRVSFKEVIRSLHGSLFFDTEVQRARSAAQDELLGSLLQTVVWQEGERRRVKSKAKLEVPPRNWTDRQLCQAPEADSACVACSVSSDSTISRTSSWASTTSDSSSSTCITSPSSSPSSNKLQLPPLVDDKPFRKQTVHSCRSFRKTRLTTVSLIETPLLRNDNNVMTQDTVKTTRRSSRERKDECVRSPLVQRVRQSVFGLVDFASRMQQSYLRTMQFSVGFQQDISPVPHSHSRTEDKVFKPEGYRANASDVQRFAPQPIGPPTRELNFPSEHNIPLGDPCDSKADSGSLPPARVFAPLAFVPPSPLRPREAPAAPEWRLRPVANPCTLRLKALANQLSGKGIVWEGRAHTGSLGCGRERLTGVAFEGLGGSRLAFEAR